MEGVGRGGGTPFKAQGHGREVIWRRMGDKLVSGIGKGGRGGAGEMGAGHRVWAGRTRLIWGTRG